MKKNQTNHYANRALIRALQAARKKKKLNQKDFCDFLKIPQAQWWGWIHGECGFTLAKATQMANRVGIDLGQIQRAGA